jgi:hypothetical protein
MKEFFDFDTVNCNFKGYTPESEIGTQKWTNSVRMPTERGEAVFQDNEESCSESFKSFDSLLLHLNIGKHKKSLQLYIAEDYALKTYLENIEEIDRSRTVPVIIDDIAVATVMSTEENDELEG